MNCYMAEYCIVDIETTGGYAYDNRVIDIAIIVHDGTKVVDRFHSLINPERSIPTQITALTGITNDMVADAPRFYEVAKTIYELTRDRIFVAHNVGFDYSFIKKEFNDLGGTFQRKRLCTVRLSRKIFTGLPSYGLGALCAWFGITNKNRHTALGDAEATVTLFEILLKGDTEGFIDKSLKRFSKEGILPPYLPKEKYDDLPEETGVYYFHNQNGKVIYVGKAKNIKDRVFSHFSTTMTTGIDAKRKSSTYDISYDLTGNELIALIYESYEIKKLNPIYNRAQKRISLNYGIYQYHDHNGYLRLAINRTKDIQQVLLSFPGLLHARKFLEKRVKEYHLCPKLCGLQSSMGSCFYYQIGKCRGACCRKETSKQYNRRVKNAIINFTLKERSFAILGMGRTRSEKSVVLIEKGVFLGYGFISGEFIIHSPSAFRDHIRYLPDNQDIQRILNMHLKKNKHDVIIPY